MDQSSEESDQQVGIAKPAQRRRSRLDDPVSPTDFAAGGRRRREEEPPDIEGGKMTAFKTVKDRGRVE